MTIGNLDGFIYEACGKKRHLFVVNENNDLIKIQSDDGNMLEYEYAYIAMNDSGEKIFEVKSKDDVVNPIKQIIVTGTFLVKITYEKGNTDVYRFVDKKFMRVVNNYQGGTDCTLFPIYVKLIPYEKDEYNVKYIKFRKPFGLIREGECVELHTSNDVRTSANTIYLTIQGIEYCEDTRCTKYHTTWHPNQCGSKKNLTGMTFIQNENNDLILIMINDNTYEVGRFDNESIVLSLE